METRGHGWISSKLRVVRNRTNDLVNKPKSIVNNMGFTMPYEPKR